MKVLVPLLLLVTQVAFATPYNANPNLTLFDKVSEVNKEWLTKDWDNPLLREPIVFLSDEAVIQTHLFLVEQFLRNHAPSHLTQSQLEKRNATLDILKGYAQRGLFPKNTNHDHRQPYFIDQYGTACAVGYLIIETGHKELAQQVSDEMNYAYIREIPYPKLLDWANAYGFTVEELAWIQPSYTVPAIWPYSAPGIGINGTVNAMQVDPVYKVLYVGGQFETTTPYSQNLITYDGNNWNSIGHPNGEVLNIQRINSDMMVMGAFDSINGIQTGPIATWDGNSWSPFAEELVGTVKEIQAYDGAWYAAGVFIDHNETFYLAKKPWNQTWEDAPWKFDGPVESITGFEQTLIIGGQFNTVDTDSMPFLVFWDGHDLSYHIEMENPVLSLFGASDALCAGAYISSDHFVDPFPPSPYYEFVKNKQTGEWEYSSSIGFRQYDSTEPAYISSIVNSDLGILISGNFYCSDPSMFAEGFAGRNGALYLDQREYGGYLHGLAWEITGPVKAIAHFDEKIYLGGVFDSINGSAISWLAYADEFLTTGLDPSLEEPSIEMSTYHHGFTFNYRGWAYSPKGQAQVFNVNGQQVDAIRPSDGQFTWNTESMPSGLYLVKLPVGEDDFAVQKVVVR